MDVNSFKTILNATVSISDLTRAGAKEVFDSLIIDESKIVLKNNKPVAALVSTKRYQELLEKEEDLQLLQLAMDRKTKDHLTISRDDFLKINQMDEKDVSNLPEIEIE